MIASEASNILALCLSFASVAIAIWAARKSNKVQERIVEIARESNSLQERIVAIETAREMDRVAAKNYTAVEARFAGNQFILTNIGAQPAFKVEAFLDGTPRAENPIVGNRMAQVLDMLAAGVSYPYHIITYDGRPREYLVRVTWENAEGARNEWTARLPTM